MNCNCIALCFIYYIVLYCTILYCIVLQRYGTLFMVGILEYPCSICFIIGQKAVNYILAQHHTTVCYPEIRL